MSTVINQRYPFDPTADAVGNLVVNELQSIPALGSRLVIAREGVFYIREVSLIPAGGGLALVLGTDYHFISLDTYITTKTGFTTATAIEIDNTSIQGDYLFTYHTVGGVEGNSNAQVADLIAATQLAKNTPVNWLDISNVPVQFPPRAHSHTLPELTELEIVTAALNNLEQAILDSRPLQARGLDLIWQDERILGLISLLNDKLNTLYGTVNQFIIDTITDRLADLDLSILFGNPLVWDLLYTTYQYRYQILSNVEINVAAHTQLGDEHISYAITDGTLPSYLTLNTSGHITGVVDNLTEDVNYRVRVRADDGFNAIAKYIDIELHVLNDTINWVTPRKLTLLLGDLDLALEATLHPDSIIMYSLVSGTLPVGVTLTSAGNLTGTVSAIYADYTFTIRASDGSVFKDKLFTAAVLDTTRTIIWAALPDYTSTGDWGELPVYDLGAVTENDTISRVINALSSHGTITYTLTAGTMPPILTVNGEGELAGTIANLPTTTVYNFTITASDGVDSTDRRFTITVVAANDLPVWVTPSSLGALSGTVNIPLEAIDPEEQTLTYSLLSGVLPSGLILNGTGLLFGSVSAVNTDAYTFTVAASDGGVAVSRDFTITPNSLENNPPTWVTGGVLGPLTGAVSIQLQATDPEGQNLTYTVTGGTLPPDVTLTLSGLLSGTVLAGNTIPYAFTVSASDGVNTVPQQFSIQPVDNLAPTWITAGALGSLTGIINLQLVATDPEGQPLAYSVTSGTLPPNVNLSSTGLLSGTIAVDNTLDYNFVIAATDGVNAVNQVFVITGTATAPNAVPTWVTSGDLGVLTGAIELQLMASDPEGQPLTYSLASGTLPPSVALSSTGLLMGSIPVNNTVEYNFTIAVTDGVNAVNQAFVITGTVAVPNTPPTWVTAGDLGTLEGSISLPLLVNDAEGNAITFSLTAGILPHAFTLSTAGLLVGILPMGNTVEYNFTITASDGDLSATRAFTISATEVYDAGIIGLVPTATPPDVLYVDTVDLTIIT